MLVCSFFKVNKHFQLFSFHLSGCWCKEGEKNGQSLVWLCRWKWWRIGLPGRRYDWAYQHSEFEVKNLKNKRGRYLIDIYLKDTYVFFSLFSCRHFFTFIVIVLLKGASCFRFDPGILFAPVKRIEIVKCC